MYDLCTCRLIASDSATICMNMVHKHECNANRPRIFRVVGFRSRVQRWSKKPYISAKEPCISAKKALIVATSRFLFDLNC